VDFIIYLILTFQFTIQRAYLSHINNGTFLLKVLIWVTDLSTFLLQKWCEKLINCSKIEL